MMRNEATKMVAELRQFGASHERNGERRTADLLFRAADYIDDMEQLHTAEVKRLKSRLHRLTENEPR